MTAPPALHSTAASTMAPLPAPAAAGAAAATPTTGQQQHKGQVEEDGGVTVVRIVDHRFVPDHVLLRGRGSRVRWINEEEDGCVCCCGCGYVRWAAIGS